MYALCGLVDMRGAPAPEIEIFLFGDTNAGSEFFLIGEVETSVDIDLSFVVTVHAATQRVPRRNGSGELIFQFRFLLQGLLKLFEKVIRE
jgi:hypothetical protein